MTAENVLEVGGLGKRFGARRVLDGVSFTVRRGEVLGLIGPNGAGKTTLFECLAGILPVDEGTVRSESGRLLAPAERRRVLFYLPDGIAPWPDLSPRAVLETFAALWGVEEELERAIAALRLGGLLRSAVGELSKGERKRFLLALGLLSPQPLWLLDEPFDGLDLRQSREVMGLLRAEVERGRTLFLSIHQLIDAARVCDRLVLLADGKVAGEGTLVELRQRAAMPAADLEEVFLALT